LITYSQGIGSTGWAAVAVTSTQNTTTAPDGTTTASKISEDATNNVHAYGQTITTVSALTYTVSFFLKSSERTFSALQVNTGSSAAWVSFDLSTGAVGTITTLAGAGLPSSTASSLSVGNGWYRFTLTFTASGTSTTVFLGTALDATTRSYTGTTGSGIFTWGAQLEQRSSVTAYTPTTTAAITNYIPALQTAASGVPRFDHNPTTGESLGLLIEEQRSNLQTYSEQFESAWTRNGTSVSANAIIAPDGIQTADKIIATATTAFHLIQGAAVTGTGSHTMSVYAKAGEYTRFAIRESNTTGHGALFDLLAGTVLTTNGGAVATITPVGNGWYRCTATVTWGTSQSFGMTLATNTNTTNLLESFTGNGFSGIYVWGAQLEAGAFATSYIPTVASQVTRSPDAASLTGTNFSSWYRQDEGTVYTAFSAFNSAPNILSGQGTTASIFYSSSLDLKTFNGTTGITTINKFSLNTTAKASLTYSTSGRSLVLNGGTISTSTGLFQTITQLSIGQSFGGYINGYIQKIAYYPKALISAEIQGLTTI
jgi:hypothetical protein